MDKELVYERLVFETFLATGYSSPNPPVACVAVDFGGAILASAHTQITGKNHAERELYQNPPFSNSILPHDLYVTLEPCSHYGRTPPCRELILKYKPRYLILGCRDPNPLVQERHAESMKAYFENGITVVFSDEVRDISYPFLNGFFSRVCKKKPKITIKVAVTKEGYFCPETKVKTQISQTTTLPFLQMLRAKVDGIIVGMGTILRDKPSLDFRIPSFQFPDKDLVQPIQNAMLSLKQESIFWSSLRNLSMNPEVWELHSLHLEYYQPKRIFMIEGEIPYFEWKEFYERQEKLRKLYPNTDIIFFLTKDRDSYTQTFRQQIERIGKIFYHPDTENPQTILRILAEEGINHLLIEGGNSLYQMFYDELDEEDTILVLRNPSISWNQGYKPCFWKNLNHHELVWKHKLDFTQEDEILVFRGRAKV